MTRLVKAALKSGGKSMKIEKAIWITAPALMAGLMFAVPSFAQNSSYSSTTTTTAPADNNAPAPADNQSTTTTTTTTNNGNSWSNSAENLGHNVKMGTEHAYYHAKRDAKDVALETRVKTTLRENKLTRHSEVHVSADSGDVTLTGHVPSAQTARRAQEVVARVYGVKAVNNDLRYPGNDSAAVTPSDSDSTGVAHPAYSHTSPAENAQ
jgi:hypothetical protein